METDRHPSSIYDLTFSQLRELLVESGLRPIHATTLWKLLYQELETDPSARTDLPPPLQRWLSEYWGRSIGLPNVTVSEKVESLDGQTRKMLLNLGDGQAVETVIMGYPGRFTACLSVQAGCAMGCVFCATGQMGFVRHLRPGEILAQIIAAQRQLRGAGHALRNLVMMGMGEPLHNYDAVMQALSVATHSPGLALGAARISVSTVGVVPGIIRFAEENQPYSLAVSLHAASDAERSALLPVNLRWPLAELLDACRFYGAKTGKKIFFGWTLIAGQNDSPESARKLVQLLSGLNAHVNLIRLNTTAGFHGVSAAEEAANVFRAAVQAAGIPCTIRQYRGIDVDAGCGQLRSARAPRSASGSGPATATVAAPSAASSV